MATNTSSSTNRINWRNILAGFDNDRRELECFANGLMRAHEFRNSSNEARRLLTTRKSEAARRLTASYLRRTDNTVAR